MSDWKFKRKTNYPAKVFEELRQIVEMGKDKVLIVPNKTQVFCYYNGLRLVDVSEKVWNIFDPDSYLKLWEDDADMCRVLEKLSKIHGGKCSENKRKQNKDFFFANFDQLIKCLDRGLKYDKERRSQEIIALNNMSFSDNEYSVCGIETSISSKYFDPAKSPGIDLVLFNPQKRDFKIVEYKCKKSSAIEGPPNVIDHCEDFLKVIERSEDIHFCEVMLDVFNFYRKLYDKKDIDGGKCSISLGFLISSRPIKQFDNNEDHIFPEHYTIISDMLNKYISSYKNPELAKSLISYVSTNNPDSVRLNAWKKELMVPNDRG